MTGRVAKATGLAGAEALEPSGPHPSDGIHRAAFTPGPWKVYRASNGTVLGIGDAEAGGVTDYQGGFWRSGDEKRANINLIAAAPELYEALNEMVRHHGGACGKARKALAKARGQ